MHGAARDMTVSSRPCPCHGPHKSHAQPGQCMLADLCERIAWPCPRQAVRQQQAPSCPPIQPSETSGPHSFLTPFVSQSLPALTASASQPGAEDRTRLTRCACLPAQLASLPQQCSGLRVEGSQLLPAPGPAVSAASSAADKSSKVRKSRPVRLTFAHVSLTFAPLASPTRSWRSSWSRATSPAAPAWR